MPTKTWACSPGRGRRACPRRRGHGTRRPRGTTARPRELSPVLALIAGLLDVLLDELEEVFVVGVDQRGRGRLELVGDRVVEATLVGGGLPDAGRRRRRRRP